METSPATETHSPKWHPTHTQQAAALAKQPVMDLGAAAQNQSNIWSTGAEAATTGPSCASGGGCDMFIYNTMRLHVWQPMWRVPLLQRQCFCCPLKHAQDGGHFRLPCCVSALKLDGFNNVPSHCFGQKISRGIHSVIHCVAA
uniref:Uncharacterized protein n=1 Tax=Eutreptiella gymnastica TaxID=73025 RepID=A0A7S4CSK0_9EUGL